MSQAQLKENVPFPSLQSIIVYPNSGYSAWLGLPPFLSDSQQERTLQMLSHANRPTTENGRQTHQKPGFPVCFSIHHKALHATLASPNFIDTKRCGISKHPRKSNLPPHPHHPIKQSSSPLRHLASSLASCCRPARLRSQGITGTAPEPRPTSLWDH